ncbi:MAG: hypothetical protein KC636_20665, partial [Myxococcales bacterium]|nr:hypothetical protein [Myxococcales bacterium]
MVPSHLWMRSPWPPFARLMRVALPIGFALAGLMATGTAVRLTLVGLGLVLFVAIPTLIQEGFDRFSRRLAAIDREQAHILLKTLRTRPLVRLFAPHGWVALQLGHLHLRREEGIEAARAYAEAAQLCRQPDAVMLVSAQAHALVVAGDRKNARKLLNKLASAKLLGPRDQLDFAIIMLTTSQKKGRQALAYLEAAQKTAIGDHPRMLAALALANLQISRADKDAQVRIDLASEQLERAHVEPDEPDAIVEDLVRRGRMALRRAIEAQLRRERRARSRRTTIVVTSEHAVDAVVSGDIEDAGVVATPSEPEGDPESLKARGWKVPEGEDKPSGPIPRGPLQKRSVGYEAKPRRRRGDPDTGSGFEIDIADEEPEEDDEDEDAAPEPDAAQSRPDATTAPEPHVGGPLRSPVVVVAQAPEAAPEDRHGEDQEDEDELDEEDEDELDEDEDDAEEELDESALEAEEDAPIEAARTPSILEGSDVIRLPAPPPVPPSRPALVSSPSTPGASGLFRSAPGEGLVSSLSSSLASSLFRSAPRDNAGPPKLGERPGATERPPLPAPPPRGRSVFAPPQVPTSGPPKPPGPLATPSKGVTPPALSGTPAKGVTPP